MSIKCSVRKVVVVSFFLGALSGAFYAHAGSELVGEPPFMDPALPDTNECITQGNLGLCHSGLGIVPTGVTTLNLKVSIDDGPTEILTVDAYPSATCTGGICKGEGGVYYGTIQDPEPHRYILVTGYYIHQASGEEEPSVYRRGTGPLANDFPQYAVRGEVSNVQPTAASTAVAVEEGSFPRCGAQYDTCLVDGEELPRSELPEFYNFFEANAEEGENYFCQMESCFDNKGGFLGLNPFYHEYR